MATTARTQHRSTDAGRSHGNASQRDDARAGAGVAHVVHHVPGRLRLKVTPAAGGDEDDDEFFDEVHALFARLPGVQDVRVNRSSRSVVLTYDPSDARFEERLHRDGNVTRRLHLGEAAELASSLDEAIGIGLHAAAHHSRLAEALVSSAQQVDRQMRQLSDGYLDLKMLLPLGVAAATTLRKTRREGTPMWMTLATFAFNTFISLHRNRIDGPTVRPGSRTVHPAPPAPR